MRRGSVRRPILLYALVFTSALGFTLTTFASLGLLRTSQGGYAAAARQEAVLLASVDDRLVVDDMILRLRGEGHFVAIVTEDSPAFGVDFEEAARVAEAPGDNRGFGAARLRGAKQPSYVVALADARAMVKEARKEIRHLLVVAALAALLASALLALFISRLVLEPLSTLERVAGEVGADPGMVSSDAPNEVVEVAQTFQRTLRQLEQERRELEEKHAELERMQDSLVRASKLASVGRLAAGVAHEIGNPLAAVLGYLSLLKRGLGEEQTKDVLERCSTQLDRIHGTIRKLLTYARQDDDAEPPAPFATRAVIEDTLILLRGHPALQAAEVHDETAELDPEQHDARGRPQALGQVLVNLIVNAAQAPGARPRQIWIRREADAGGVRLTVSDDGDGIPEEKREQVFDPFFTTKAPGEGTGLGLAVSRALIERMEGELSLGGSAAGGAEFAISLPAAIDPAANPAADSAADPAADTEPAPETSGDA